MSKLPDQLRHRIAARIRECRKAQFPGPGGSKRCAEAFGVAPQQWSPWETGFRTPTWARLEQIADFFHKPLEYLYESEHPQEPPARRYEELSAPELIIALGRDRMKAVYRVEVSVSEARFVPQSSDSGGKEDEPGTTCTKGTPCRTRSMP